MTKEEILAMEAGRELDENIHKAFFGGVYKDTAGEIFRVDGKYDFGRPIEYVPYYSTDWSAAGQVVEKTGEAWWKLKSWADSTGVRWQADLMGNAAEAKAAPEAICKAALLAKLKAPG